MPNQLADALVKWIDRSNEELILVSAYLIPTPELEAAIERAESRDVRVRILWVADDIVLNSQPADSAFQRIEDWFISILPVEEEI